MSGLTGHINHLYEDPNLSLSDIISIYRNIAKKSETIKIYEKVDGYNIYLSYSTKDNKAKLLRNNGQIKSGGISLQDLKEEYTIKRIQAGKPAVPANVVAAYVNLIEYFEKVVKAVFDSREAKIAVFGEDSSGNPEYFFNAEVIDPGAPNVIRYDRKLLIFHKLGNVKINSSDGTIVETDGNDVLSRFEELKKLFGKSNSNNGIEISDDRESKIDSVDIRSLELELGILHGEFKKFGLDAGDTVGKYFIKSIEQYLKRDTNKLDSSEIEFITKSVLSVGFGSGFLKKPKINDFFQRSGASFAGKLKNFTNEDPAKEIFKIIKAPIEQIFFNCSSILLDKYESVYISDNKQTADDIIKMVNNAVTDIKNNGTPEQKNKLTTNMKKLRSSTIKFEDLINNPVEGIVFKFNNRTYKITSSFGPVNQIVNMGKTKTEQLTENIEINGVKVLFAGAFKPPHKGHLEVIKNFIQLPKLNKKNFTIEKVIVIVGNKSRASENKEEFDLNQSLDLFKLFIRSAGLESVVELRIAQRDSPVKDVYDYIANTDNDPDKAQPGDLILLGVSQKDKGYYSNLAKFVKDKPWRILFGEEYEIPMVFRGGGEEGRGQDLLSEFSASEFRKSISNNNLLEVDSFLPYEVLSSPDSKREAYRILGIELKPQELNEKLIIQIINNKFSSAVVRAPKLNLNVLIDRVNSIYNR